MDARLIVDSPAPGPWNMAVDEALFLELTAASPAVFRLYQWSEPTLSLGYFQSIAQRAMHAASSRLPLVRRPTGGGAIVHDLELTYSLTLPLTESPDVAQSFVEAVHTSLANVLSDLQITVHAAGPSAADTFQVRSNQAAEPVSRDGTPLPLRWDGTPLPSGRDRSPNLPQVAGDQDEPFLCFQRRAEQDLLISDWKVAGSAQRRRRIALLQHGSILLRRSSAAPELPGIEDLAQVTGLARHLIDRWPSRLADDLQWRFVTSDLKPSENERAQHIVREKYAAAAWNRRR